jgi:hypothetical protein
MRLTGPLPERFLRLMSKADRALFAPGQLTNAEAVDKMKAKDERQLQGWLVGLLRLRGIEPLWFRTDKRTAATVGWPDITFAVEGHAIAWEAKMPGEKPRSEQVAVHCRMIRNGWTVEVVHTLEEARVFLDALGTRAATE